MKKLLLFLAAVIIGYLLFAHYAAQPSGSLVQIYFPDKNNLFLVPVTRSVPEKRVSPQALLDLLEKGPADSNHLLPAFSPKESPVTIASRGGSLIADFSEAPALDRWPLMIQSFLATFKQLPDYDSMEFLVHGEEAVLLNGEEIGKEPFSSLQINENLEAAAPECPDSGCPRIIVYRQLNGTLDPNRHDPYLVPITQNVTDKLPLEQAIAEALKIKPKLSWALSPALAPGSQILKADRPNAETVDLVLDLKGTAVDKAQALEAVLLTYSDLPGVKFVRYRLTGSWIPKTFVKKPFGITVNTEARE